MVGALKPRFFYGWIIVAVSFFTVALAGLSRLSYSIILLPVQGSLGCTRAQACLPFSISMLVFSLLTPVVGRVLDRQGPRRMMPAGVLVLAGGLVLSSRSRSLLEFTLCYGIMVSAGAAALLTVPHSAILANWFKRWRGLATGIVFAAFGVGAMAGIPLLQAVVNGHGWRAAYRVYPLVLVLALVPVNALFQRMRPSDMGLRPDGAAAAPGRRTGRSSAQVMSLTFTPNQALGTKALWYLASSSFLWGTRMMIVQIHLVAYLNGLGFPPLTAAKLFALTSLAMSAGSFLGGLVADWRLGHRGGFLAGGGLEIVGVVVMMATAHHMSLPILTAAAVLYGVGAGAQGSCGTAVSTNVFGGPDRAGIVGIINLPFGIGGAAGPFVAGVLFDALGSYRVPFCVVCGASLGSMALITLADRWACRRRAAADADAARFAAQGERPAKRNLEEANR